MTANATIHPDFFLIEYRRSSPFEIGLLHLLSIIYDWANRSNLTSCLTYLGIKKENGKRYVAADLDIYIDRMIGAGLLQQDKKATHPRFRCPSECADLLARSLKEDILDKIIEAVQIAIPAEERYSRYSKNEEYYFTSFERFLRELRISILKNDAKKFQKIYQEGQLQLFEECRRTPPLHILLNSPLNLDYVKTRAKEIQHELIDYIVKNNLRQLGDLSDVELLATPYLEASESSSYYKIRHGFAYIYLLQGEHKSLVDLIGTGFSRDEAFMLMAASIILQKGSKGSKESIKIFEETLKNIRKTHKKRTAIIPGLDGIFYILSLISTREATQLSRARQLCKQAAKQAEPENIPIYQSLHATLAFLAGEPEEKVLYQWENAYITQ
ncbi:hypothetical protein ACQZV8_18815, partial [Magnetococcales bacterium HHB-1]